MCVLAGRLLAGDQLITLRHERGQGSLYNRYLENFQVTSKQLSRNKIIKSFQENLDFARLCKLVVGEKKKKELSTCAAVPGGEGDNGERDIGDNGERDIGDSDRCDIDNGDNGDSDIGDSDSGDSESGERDSGESDWCDIDRKRSELAVVCR